MIDARRISVTLGETTVLSDVSIALSRGTILAVIGPNGAGKTTLLKALNRSVEISSGEIEIVGTEIASMSRAAIARRIAVVAQENETRFPITVREFILAGRFASGGAFGWESETDLDAAGEATRKCGLAGYESRLMNELSGGERQRVVLARAIATNAEILLLDEPTANLDLAHQAMMFRLIRKHCDEIGLSAVVIAHDLNLVAQFADEVLMLKDGRTHSYGRPEQILTAENISDVFGVKVLLDNHPANDSVRVTNVY